MSVRSSVWTNGRTDITSETLLLLSMTSGIKNYFKNERNEEWKEERSEKKMKERKNDRKKVKS